MAEFSGKVVLITGAGSGFGRVIAELFAQNGARVALMGRDATNLEETKKRIGGQPDDVFIARGDISKEADCEQVVKSTVQHFGRLDVLVNNAGVAWADSVETFTEALPPGKSNETAAGAQEHMQVYTGVFDTNFKGPVVLTHFAVPHLAASKGAVVNVSSIHSFRVRNEALSYGCSKAALDQFTRMAALELAPKGIRVNSVNPTTSITELFGKLGMTPDDITKMSQLVSASAPLGRMLEPVELAQVVLFLASPRASYLTGVVLPVEGGMTNNALVNECKELKLKH